MKRLILIIIILTCLTVGGCTLTQSNDFNLTVTPSATFTPTPTTADPETISLNFEDKTYQISWFTIKDPEQLTLIANFQNKLSADEIIKKHACQRGINAGFYGKDNRPLGIFINDQNDRKNKLESNLFNGIFYLTSNNLFSIEEELPDKPLKFALQSGPFLIFHKNTLPLKIIDDKLARRMVVATNEKEIIFLAVYDKISPLQGPYLSSLPKIIEAFSQKTGREIINALNLDGGSASAFTKPGLQLKEISAVGGFFCHK